MQEVRKGQRPVEKKQHTVSGSGTHDSKAEILQAAEDDGPQVAKQKAASQTTFFPGGHRIAAFWNIERLGAHAFESWAVHQSSVCYID